MKPKTIMLLAVAGVCGLVSLLGFQAMQTGQKAPKVEKARVLVVVDEIGAGSALNQDNVTFREIPVSSLPKDPVLNEAQYKDRSALIPMMAGDIVRMSKLTEPGVSGASSQIPKGWRVTTISVNDNHTNSGMLRPGDRVDVLVTYKTSAGRATSTKTKTLLEYVEIFATDNQTASKADNETKKVKNVSLLLTPEQVNYVLLAASKGNLSLSWRHRMDDELVQVGDIDDALRAALRVDNRKFADMALAEYLDRGAHFRSCFDGGWRLFHDFADGLIEGRFVARFDKPCQIAVSEQSGQLAVTVEKHDRPRAAPRFGACHENSTYRFVSPRNTAGLQAAHMIFYTTEFQTQCAARVKLGEVFGLKTLESTDD